MGVTKEVLKAGNGSKPSAGQSVTVHCTGYGKNRDLSKKFWCKFCCSTAIFFAALLGCADKSANCFNMDSCDDELNRFWLVYRSSLYSRYPNWKRHCSCCGIKRGKSDLLLFPPFSLTIRSFFFQFNYIGVAIDETLERITCHGNTKTDHDNAEHQKSPSKTNENDKPSNVYCKYIIRYRSYTI